MPNQVYRFDPVTGHVRVVATDFNRCNGIALSEDGKLAYMYVFPFSIPISAYNAVADHRSDTAAAGGFLGVNQTNPATMQVLNFLFCLNKSNCFPFPTPGLGKTHRYAFDVDPDSQAFLNRRVFAYTDAGIPDGIQIDKNGNVYAGCGDGVQVRVSFHSIFPFFPSLISSLILRGVFFLTRFYFFIVRHLIYSRKTRYGTLKAPS